MWRRLLPFFAVAACVSSGVKRKSGEVAPVAPPTTQATTPRPEQPAAEAIPKILVNQVGYFTNLAKIATLRSGAKDPLDWKLYSGDGAEVAYGKTEPAGVDVPSGDEVHVIDFSDFKTAGRGYVLGVGSDRSRPFEIGTALYRTLKYDALSYFYHNRSGIEITLPFAGAEKWTRPAGHMADKSVPCAPDSGCSYSLDVAGGWYDAGDHGKYVVSGAVSVWTMLNLFERAMHISKSAMAAFADGTMNIPERKNGVPDLLDEARWELELLLKMQVPSGEPLAGMVHHKMHDKSWTSLGLAPHEDPMPRFLQPVSTAATLDLAAVAAQAGRVFKAVDAKFAARCISAAEKAWAAAIENPHVLAKGGDGGGPYTDDRLDDELYWAAAELFITTKRPAYRQSLVASPFYLKLSPIMADGADDEGISTSMSWRDVAALGTISLAVVPSALAAPDQKKARAVVTQAGDAYLDLVKRRGYRVPIEWGKKNKAPWGSNSAVLNNLIILALTADFTSSRKYLNAVVAGMDYILGRNAMGQCYVTGYGSKPLTNPHHRFWAHQANSKYPPPPPGAVSGGPNSGLQDPYVKSRLQGCAPEKCFADHIESWSTNEVAINWNAPLAWVAFYLDDRAPSVRATR